MTVSIGCSLVLSGCNTPWPYIGGAAGATVVGGQSPTNELEQVYYLGTFDPQEQVPPAVYRVTVRGQGSFISQTKFASGWVPANLVDTLNESIGFNEQGQFGVRPQSGDVQPPVAQPPISAPPIDKGKPVDTTKPDTTTTQAAAPPDRTGAGQPLPTGRRLIMFGPEGFREAPRDHRLVIVMGDNPQAFFKAVGDSLGEIHAAKFQVADTAGAQAILREKLRIESEFARLSDLRADLARRSAR